MSSYAHVVHPIVAASLALTTTVGVASAFYTRLRTLQAVRATTSTTCQEVAKLLREIVSTSTRLPDLSSSCTQCTTVPCTCGDNCDGDSGSSDDSSSNFSSRHVVFVALSACTGDTPTCPVHVRALEEGGWPLHRLFDAYCTLLLASRQYVHDSHIICSEGSFFSFSSSLSTAPTMAVVHAFAVDVWNCLCAVVEEQLYVALQQYEDTHDEQRGCEEGEDGNTNFMANRRRVAELVATARLMNGKYNYQLQARRSPCYRAKIFNATLLHRLERHMRRHESDTYAALVFLRSTFAACRTPMHLFSVAVALVSSQKELLAPFLPDRYIEMSEATYLTDLAEAQWSYRRQCQSDGTVAFVGDFLPNALMPEGSEAPSASCTLTEEAFINNAADGMKTSSSPQASPSLIPSLPSLTVPPRISLLLVARSTFVDAVHRAFDALTEAATQSVLKYQRYQLTMKSYIALARHDYVSDAQWSLPDAAMMALDTASTFSFTDLSSTLCRISWLFGLGALVARRPYTGIAVVASQWIVNYAFARWNEMLAARRYAAAAAVSTKDEQEQPDLVLREATRQLRAEESNRVVNSKESVCLDFSDALVPSYFFSSSALPKHSGTPLTSYHYGTCVLLLAALSNDSCAAVSMDADQRDVRGPTTGGASETVSSQVMVPHTLALVALQVRWPLAPLLWLNESAAACQVLSSASSMHHAPLYTDGQKRFIVNKAEDLTELAEAASEPSQLLSLYVSRYSLSSTQEACARGGTGAGYMSGTVPELFGSPMRLSESHGLQWDVQVQLIRQSGLEEVALGITRGIHQRTGEWTENKHGGGAEEKRERNFCLSVKEITPSSKASTSTSPRVLMFYSLVSKALKLLAHHVTTIFFEVATALPLLVALSIAGEELDGTATYHIPAFASDLTNLLFEIEPDKFEMMSLSSYGNQQQQCSFESGTAPSSLIRSGAAGMPESYFCMQVRQLQRTISTYPGYTESLAFLQDRLIASPTRPMSIDSRRWQQCVPLAPGAWSVEMRNVWFRYPSRRNSHRRRHHGGAQDGEDAGYILRDVSFAIHAGQKLGIIGFSGAGKTTLLRLVTRLYTPNKGTILINGIPVEEYPPRDLRRRIGNCWQAPDDLRFLEEMSVGANIALGHVPGASPAAVEAALCTAQASECVRQRGSGISALLRTGTFSGGELERLNVARSLLKPQTTLGLRILDETTSALDSITEKAVMSALWSTSSHKASVQTEVVADSISLDRINASQTTPPTCLVAAHRLSSVMDADNILVLVDGQIVEHGTWQDLCSNKQDNKYFHLLLEAQRGGGEVAAV